MSHDKAHLRLVTPSEQWAPRNPKGDKGYDGGGGDPPMDGRIDRLEADVRDVRERLVRIEAQLEGCASKADMHREFSAQTWKIVGAMITIAGLAVAITRYLN